MSGRFEISPEFKAYLLKMSCTVKGKERPIFMIQPKKDGFIQYICTICDRICNSKNVMGSKSIENLITQHIRGKIHRNQVKMQMEIEIESKELSWPHQHPNEVGLNNGSQSIISATGATQSSPFFISSLVKVIEEMQSPFVGIEYVVEFIDGSVCCFLCNFLSSGNAQTSIIHLQSLKHEETYLLLHFSSVLKFINDMEEKVSQSNVSFIPPGAIKRVLMKEVVAAIRKLCGVLQPKFYQGLSSSSDHLKLTQWIATDKEHFNEKDQPQIKNMFNEDYVKTLMIESFERIFPKPAGNFTEDVELSTEWESESIVYEDCSKSDDDNIEDSEIVDLSSLDEDMNGDEGMQLTDGDYKVLLENCDTLELDLQKKLFIHVKAEHERDPRKFDKLRQNLTAKATALYQNLNKQ